MRATFAPLLVSAVLLSGCRHAPPAVPKPLFPMLAAWTTPLPATVEGPLASDGSAVYVATRDGAVRSLEASSGRVRWTVEGRPGVVGVGDGLLVVRHPDGTIWGMGPGRGTDRWKAASGVAGSLPPVIYKDAVVVAGTGLAVLESATGRERWSAPEARPSALPVAWGQWLLVGEADGALRCRDLATGAVLWSYKTAQALAAPPVVDPDGRVLLGTTDRRFLALELDDKGDEDWRWKLGGDVQTAPVVFGPHVLFTNHEDVLYALRRRNGHLAWRAALPSRPLSGPLPYGDGILVACFGSRPGETFLIGFDARTGRRLGDLKAPGEVRTPPIIVGDLVVMALRERAVSALRLGDVAANP
jgi:outer membrane protein assembly factor BamB